MTKWNDWRLAVTAALTMTSAAAIAHDYAVGEVHIDHPWARPTIAASVPAAVYFEMRNAGKADDRLIAASTDRAAYVEIHASLVDEKSGAMKMRVAKDGVPSPAGKTVSMETGSYHIMLIGLDAPLKEGEEFPLTLTFEKAGEVDVVIYVEDREAKGGHHHGH